VKFIYSVLILYLISVPALIYGEETPGKKKVLTLQECIDTAVKQHPGIIAAKNSISAGESRIGEAYSSYYPQLSASTGYNRVSSTTTSNNSVTGNQYSKDYNQYAGSVNLNQNIYDFGKTSAQVNIQKAGTDAARQNYDNTMLQVIYNVKIAYYGLLQSKKSKDVAVETVAQMQAHLDQAKGYFDVHMKSKLDVTTAEMNLSNAKLNLIQAEDAVKIAVVTLNNALGYDVTVTPEYEIEDNLIYQQENLNFDGLISEALKNRPDYLAEQFKIKSLERSKDLAGAGYLPSINGNGAYSMTGTQFPLNREWNLGVSVTLPIFSGFLTANQVKEADANLNAEKANAELLRQQIVLSVQQAMIKVRQAEKTIPAAELTVSQAAENLELANGRYQAGVGNMTEVSDAQVSYISAKTAYINALYNYKVARASLDQSIGVK